MSRDRSAILLGGGPIAVSVARSLGRAGIRVYALGSAPPDTVAYSRYCDVFVNIRHGEGVQERWLSWLDSGPMGGVFLPCHDEALDLVAHHRASLVDRGYFVYEANDEVVLAMLDKQETYSRARRAGVATPSTFVVRDQHDVEPALHEIGFPCALKPLHAHRFVRHFGFRQKAFIVRDRAQFDDALANLLKLGLEVMVTEIIPGGDDQLFSFITYVDDNGNPLFRFVKRKLRQFPPGFGMGCYHVEEWNPIVAELGWSFFEAIGLRGFAYVEFKRDARDNAFKLIECNHRFGTGIELLTAAGIDAPLITYRRALGQPVSALRSYRRGVRLWHPLDDTRTFLIYRRKRELSIAAWIRSLMHPLRVPIFRWYDPKPTLVSHWLLLKALRKRLSARTVRR